MLRIAGVLITTMLLASGVLGAEKREPRIVFNDDARMLMEAPQEETSKFVREWLDKEAEAVPFSTFVFLAATPDICTFDSQAGETYGVRFGPNYSSGWAAGIRGLRAEGTDVLRVVTDHMRGKGKEVLAAIRMNDTHHRKIDHGQPLCPQFAIDNPQFVIKQPDQRTNETALDYSYPEVREHRLAIMREIVEDYDVDGLELNFVRWAKHFPRDKSRDNAPIMTEFVGQVREMLDTAAEKRSRSRLTLGVRVPESVDVCWLAGVDIEEWVQRGWIDFVVIATWNNTDPQIRVDEFARFTKPAGVDAIVLMGNMIGNVHGGPPSILDRPIAMSGKQKTGSYVAMLITESEARAAAANYYTWGADSISFWNVGIHFGKEDSAAPEQQARMARWTTAVRSRESVFAGPRTYRYLPMGKGMSSRKPPVRSYPWYDEGRSPLGHVNSPVLTFDDKHLGKRLAFPFRMADGRNGEALNGRLTFWVYRLGEKQQLSVDVNGQLVDQADIDLFPTGKRRGGLPGQRFEIALADCPPFRGDNELGLTLKATGGESQSGGAYPYMEELEIVVEQTAVGQQASEKQSLKIYIAVDSEGPTGVEQYWARNLDPEDPRFRQYRELMTADVNAAIDGCFAAGATEVYVKDDGFQDENLLPNRLDRRARLLPGGTPLLTGLDESFDGVMLVGFHAMEGAEDGVLAHTWSSGRRRRYWFNDVEGGEVAAYAIVAGHDHRLPIIMATGCTGLCREVQQLLGEQVVTVAVKRQGESGAVELYPPEETQRAIADGARRAVEQIAEYKPYLVKFPLHVRLQLENKAVTDGYEKWRLENKPGWPGRRAGDNTLEADLKTTKHIVL